MTVSERRKAIVEHGFPNARWTGEPGMGSWYTEEEVKAVTEAVRSSMDWTIGFGFICDEIVEFERGFAEYCGTEFAISVTSAGAGLDMAIMALDLEPGDEVICPAINFRAGHYSILGFGGKLVFCEVDPMTLCADPADVERRITPKTRAVLVTHMNGMSADMDALLEVAARHSHPKHGPIKVIGDAARACGGGYKGSKIGKKGAMTVFSFHTMKLMTTLGEGGMITTDDPGLAQRLRGIRQWGTGTDQWGGNYKMTKIQAAVGIVQLRRLEEMLELRHRRGRERTAMLRDFGVGDVTLPVEPEGYWHTYYLYTLMVPPGWAGEKRDEIVTILSRERGIGTIIANPPTYLGCPYIANRTEGQRLPLSEEIGRRLFCPSLHPLMSEADNEYVAACISEAIDRVARGGREA